MKADIKTGAASTRKRPVGVESFSRWAAPSEVGWPRKPPRIDIKFPILGFLMESEMTGYDIKRRFRDPIGFFYRASDGSLYPALHKLEQEGWITAEWKTSENGRRAKYYSLTRLGRRQLEKETDNWGRLSNAISRIIKLKDA